MNFVLEDVDVKVLQDDGLPTIIFFDRAQRLMADSMRNYVVVKLLGMSIGYQTLWTRIHTLWKPTGEIKIVDLDHNDYLIIRLNSYKNYLKTLLGGP